MIQATPVQALIKRLQSGEPDALEPLIEATRGSASRLAYSIVQDRDRCQDVLQDVYLAVYQKIGQLRDLEAFRAWFTRIIVNRCRAELRQRTDLLEDHQAEAERLTAPPDGLEARLEVRQAMQCLSRPDRLVLTLREVMELSYQELADILEIPLGTVRSRIFNARQRLLQLITKGRPS